MFERKINEVFECAKEKGGGLKDLKNKIFSISYEIKSERKYKVIRILFLKIKHRVLCVNGENNEIYINGKKADYKKLFKQKEMLNFCVNGNNNKIYLPELTKFNSSRISIIGNNNIVEIKDTRYDFLKIHIDLLREADDRKVFMDENCSSNHNVYIVCHGNGRKINIGKDCMLGSSTSVKTTDYHYIYNLETGEKLNSEKDVIIGNHVWSAKDSFIAKGSVIPDGCVIAAKAFANKKFEEENCILAGLPAKVVKRNIKWER